METAFITIPFDPAKEVFDDEDFQKFLLNKKVKRVLPEFFQMPHKAYWTVFAEYETILDDAGPKRKTPALSEPEQTLFNKLRIWRTDKAEKEGIPVFIISTNRELTEIVTKKCMTFEALRQIKGFGKKKVERHGREILEIVKAFHARKPIYGPKGEQGHDR